MQLNLLNLPEVASPKKMTTKTRISPKTQIAHANASKEHISQEIHADSIATEISNTDEIIEIDSHSFNKERKKIIKEYTVTELSYELKKTLEVNFDSIKIRGEVSGLKIAISGHAYFNLKDQNAVLACTCWRPVLSTLKIPISEGMEIIAIGKITTYQGQSKYQLNVLYIHHTGLGALMQILEERKKQLSKEGLFESKYKKSIPFLPKRIGIITSLSGVVIRDIIHRIKDRCPIVNLMIWSASMQGDSCAQEVIEGISIFNSMEHAPEVIIIARGGGSIEDLWSFNEESVIRAAFSSNIPIISAIGHETDFTLFDFVSDVRAPTPTAAAEMVVPVVASLKLNLCNYGLVLRERLESKILYALQILKSYNNTILYNSDNFLYRYDQQIDMISMKLFSSLPNLLKFKQILVQKYKTDSLGLNNLIKLLELKLLNMDLSLLYKNFYSKKHNNLKLLTITLEKVDISRILQLGFSIIKDKDGKIIHKSAEMQIEDEINIQMCTGTRKARVIQ